jgi:hypothetical protein
MGVEYNYYLIPELAAMRFLPSPQQVSEIVALLKDLGWVDRKVEDFSASLADSSGKRYSAKMRIASLGEDVSNFMTKHDAMLFNMPGVPAEEIWPDGHLRVDGTNRKYEFEECDPALFKPEYADEIWCVLSQHLCTVPEDYNESPVPCPSCQGDVSVPIEGNAPQGLVALFEIGINSVPSDRCPSCKHDLQLETLICESRDGTTGELRPEPAPFFRCAVVLSPAPRAIPHAEPVKVHGELLEGLKKICGVTFRGVGRYG